MYMHNVSVFLDLCVGTNHQDHTRELRRRDPTVQRTNRDPQEEDRRSRELTGEIHQ